MKGNPRILLYSDAYLSGGAEQYLLELARGLPRDEFRVAAVASTEEAVDGFVSKLKDLDVPVERLRPIHSRGDEQIRELAQQFYDFRDNYDDMNFTQPYLSTVSARTLIVHGDRDPFFPVEIPLEMYRGIPNASLWIIPQGGHVPIFDPLVPFVQTALKFLESNGQ